MLETGVMSESFSKVYNNIYLKILDQDTLKALKFNVDFYEFLNEENKALFKQSFKKTLEKLFTCDQQVLLNAFKTHNFLIKAFVILYEVDKSASLRYFNELEKALKISLDSLNL